MPLRLRPLLGSLIALAVIVPAVRPTASGPAAPPAIRHLYVMLMPGLCGWPNSDCGARTAAQGRARATFARLIDALGAAHIRYTPVYYSYNPNHPDAYSPGDTRQAVSRSVLALDRQLRAVWKRDSSAQIDLAAYSLGGVVAANWAVTTGRRTGRLNGVHSIVTLDSPLKGVNASTLDIVAQFLGGSVWGNLRPKSATIRAITGFTNAWWRTAGHLHTAANTADKLVPPSEALLGDQKVVTDSNCPADFLTIHLCHGAILTDTNLARFVACHWITTGAQCQATPTPTLAPTSTPVPTATATPTAAPSPTPTPTATVTLRSP